MINNKKNIFKIIILFLAFMTINVNAASISYHSEGATGITILTDQDNTYNYSDPHFTINMNGSNYEGYCVDPGYAWNTNIHNVTCSPLTSSPAMTWLLNNLTGDHVVDQLAIRMLAIREELNKQISEKGTAIVLYIQERELNGYSGRLSGDAVALQRIDRAYNMHKEALEHKNDTVVTAASLSFSKTSGSGSQVTYRVTSTKHISDIEFTCDGCTVNSKTWNGTSGTITVTATNQNCSFTINAYYLPSGAYLCKANGVNYQNIIMNAGSVVTPGDIDTSGTPTETFTGTIDAATGGSYYEAYCKNFCSEKTKVEIPPYCDDDGGEEIKITAPENVKQCVLKGKDDAGNTYQSTAVASTNPYCAVYCKEDYKMSLPGAKYTNSGQYFKLENTLVQGTRSCYVTGNPSKNDTDGIDLVQYKKDIVTRQKNLIDKYNEYSKKKALYDKISTATKSTTTACDGTTTYDKYTLSNVSYKKYTYSCNDTTGKCTITEGTDTASATWGKSVSKSYSTVACTEGSTGCTCTTVSGVQTCTKSVCSNSVTDHGSAPAEPSTNDITNATNSLKSTINNLSACYNWTNDYCFDPDVAFDYEESYSSDIKYQQIGGVNTSQNMSYGTAIDDQYNTSGGGSVTTTVNYIGCSSSGCTTSGNKAENISETVTYIKKIVTKSAEYNNTQQFQTNYPHGTIDTVANPDAVRENYSYLGAVFPVALKTKTGTYNWTIAFEKIGQYNNQSSCRLGRLNDVAKAVGATLSDEIGYVCVYIVDCPDCPWECSCDDQVIPDGWTCVKESQYRCPQYPPEPTCDDCEIYCINCIFDGKTTYSYRTISLTSTNPNNRTMGYNWSNVKGETTKTEIERNNENIYKNPEYSYTITPAQMKNIRDYNKNKGTYIADDLDYQNQGGYKNVYGISTFLNEGERKGFFTENKRNTSWTLWTGEVNTNGLGPSWK